VSRKIIQKIIEDTLKDENTFLLLGDVGVNVFDKIDNKRIINFGIREQSMISFAAGMCAAGANVIVYSIAPFVTTRAAEQVKIDVCQQELPIIIIGTGSGLSYSLLGPTHHCPEDISIMSTFPNMKIQSPYFEEDFDGIINFDYPKYIRLSNEPKEIKKVTQETLYVCSGNIVEELDGMNFYYVKDLKPFDKNIPIHQYENIVVIDESYSNGFKSLFLDEYYDQIKYKNVKFLYVDKFPKKCGTQNFLRNEIIKDWTETKKE
jgi:hypothetical protein